MSIVPRAADDALTMVDPRTRALALAVRQALLMIVDAIEVWLGMEVRTAELRRRLK